MGWGKKKSFTLMWRCNQLLSGFLANDHLPRVSRQLFLPINDKCDTGRMCLTAEENPEKSQPGERLIKAVRSVIASNGAPYFQMRPLGSHSKSGREKERMKESFTLEWQCNYFLSGFVENDHLPRASRQLCLPINYKCNKGMIQG
jgi:hypothetical protein